MRGAAGDDLADAFPSFLVDPLRLRLLARAALCPSAGPFAVNGVPLRRVNQAYVIATSTKVDVAAVKLPATVDDSFFKPAKEIAAKKGEKDFFALQKVEKTTSAERKALQTTVDGAIKASSEVKAYLKAKFTLTKGDKPHAMVF